MLQYFRRDLDFEGERACVGRTVCVSVLSASPRARLAMLFHVKLSSVLNPSIPLPVSFVLWVSSCAPLLKKASPWQRGCHTDVGGHRGRRYSHGAGQRGRRRCKLCTLVSKHSERRARRAQQCYSAGNLLLQALSWLLWIGTTSSRRHDF